MIRLFWWEGRRSSEQGVKSKMGIVALISTIVIVMGCLLDPQNVQENSADTSEYTVRDLQLIRERGFYPRWSHTKNLIAFNELVEGEAFTPQIPGTCEIFIMKPDGTDARCLTCSAPSILRKYHKGQPFWHPSGEYIVFTAQNEHTQPTQYNLDSFPGIGHNHDVWIMTSDGSNYWRLTGYPDNWGVIRPSFSHDGKMVYWNEEYSMEVYPGEGSRWNKETNRKGEEWGLWRIKSADVSFASDGPHLSNVRTIDINEMHPGFRLIEGSGFTPDDNHLIWEAANINETDGMMWWGDIYVSDLDGGSLERITHTAPLYQGNENMEYSPDGTKIAWSHHDDEEPGRKVEMYLMDAEGSNPTRLTYFNEPGHPHREEYQKFGFTNACGELDWGPYGRSIVFSMSNGGKPLWPYIKPNIYMLTFEGQARLLQGVYLPVVLR